MTREEKEQRIQEPDGKVFEALKVRITESHRCQQYVCLVSVDNVMTSTGHLKFFDLVPVSEGLPSFKARWDEKDESVDIDIKGVSEQDKNLFKDGKRGYSGHWSRRTPTANTIYTYDVCIQIPQGKVFEGTVDFTVVRRQGMTGKARIVS
jgi:hypothetical protein